MSGSKPDHHPGGEASVSLSERTDATPQTPTPVVSAKLEEQVRWAIQWDLDERVLPEYLREFKLGPARGPLSGWVGIASLTLTPTPASQALVRPSAPFLDVDLLLRLRAGRDPREVNLQNPKFVLRLLGRLSRAAGTVFRRAHFDALLAALRVECLRPGAVLDHGLLRRTRRGWYTAGPTELADDFEPGLFAELLEALDGGEAR